MKTCTYFSMKKTYSLRALILLSCLVFSLSITCAFPQSSKSEAGNGTATNILLNARIKPSFSDDHPEIECEIINTTPSPVDYDAWLDSLGFDFRLRDAQGVDITMNERWFAFNSPRYREWTKTRTRKISSGDKITYTLRLDEAFGPDWKRGFKLEVGWFQKGSHDTEPTLSTEVLLPLAKMTASETVKEPNAIERAGASPTVQWLVWTIGFIAAVGLLWLAIRKQK